MPWRTFLYVIWLALYVVVLAAVAVALFQTRRQVLIIYTTAEAQQDWQKWVAEAKRQEQGEGPVRRRAPRVSEPPAAILMRDHFATCLAGALILSSALYWSLAFMLHGAFFVRHPQPPG